MLLSEFDYALPPELIAQQPLEDRAASRMLVLDRARASWEDRRFTDFPSYLHPGDCLVLNDSRVFPSRLIGRREHGTGQVEVFLVRPLGDLTWEALVHPGRKMRTGERIPISDDLTAEILARGEHGQRTVRLCLRDGWIWMRCWTASGTRRCRLTSAVPTPSPTARAIRLFMRGVVP